MTKRYDIELFIKDNPHIELIKLKKGDTLLPHNELMKYFYIITKGKIKTYQINFKNSKEQTLSILRDGDMFDTITLLDGKVHEVMYEVLENSELIQMPLESVRELLMTNREFNKRFFPYIAKQMREMEELASDLSLYSTYERLVKLILQNLDPNNKSKYHLLTNLSNTEIAKLLGTVRHVVERHLKQLKSTNLIEKKNKQIQIKDTKKLLENLEIF